MKKFYLLAIGAFFIAGCGGGSGSNNNNTVTTYTGAGSVWETSLNSSSNTFDIKRKATPTSSVNFQVKGNYNTTASNLLDMVVTAIPNPNSSITVNIGDTAVALEIPNYALFLNFNNTVTPMTHLDSCPTTTKRWNFISTSSSTAEIGEAIYTPAMYNTAQGFMQITVRDTTTYAILSNNLYNTTCSNGIISFTDLTGDNFEGFVSSSGAFVAHNTTTTEKYFGVMQDNSLTNVNNLDGTYTGISFNNSTNAVSYHKIICNNGNCSGNEINLNDNAISATYNFNLSINSSAPSGMIETVVGGDRVICGVDLNANGNKNIITCIKLLSPGFENLILYKR